MVDNFETIDKFYSLSEAQQNCLRYDVLKNDNKVIIKVYVQSSDVLMSFNYLSDYYGGLNYTSLLEELVKRIKSLMEGGLVKSGLIILTVKQLLNPSNPIARTQKVFQSYSYTEFHDLKNDFIQILDNKLSDSTFVQALFIIDSYMIYSRNNDTIQYKVTTTLNDIEDARLLVAAHYKKLAEAIKLIRDNDPKLTWVEVSNVLHQRYKISNLLTGSKYKPQSLANFYNRTNIMDI